MHNDIDVNEVLRDLGLDSPMEEVVVNTNETSLSASNIGNISRIDDIVASAVEYMNPVYTDYEEVSIMEEDIPSTIETVSEVSETALAEVSSTPTDTPNPNLLPLNSDSYKVNDTTIRFSGASWFEEVQSKSIIIGGAGGISSWLTMILSRLRPTQIFIYDDDIVETVNLAGQFFMLSSVNSRKVDAIAKLVKDFSDYHAIMAVPDRFTLSTPGGNIMMCGFDNMEARKTFFTVWKNHIDTLNEEERNNCLYLDGRLDMSSMQIFCITGNDTYNIERYSKEFLFTDEEAEETVCSMKQTTYCASMIGSLMCNMYTNFCANLVGGMFDLPFLTYYDANCVYLKTEA